MAVLTWRLGLGWLIGRWLVLITTAETRVAVPYRLFAGTFYVERTDAPWVADLDRSPPATVQAWPGPRSVRARPVRDDERDLTRRLWGRDLDLIALDPTGQRTPEMAPPDLVWVWAVAAAVVVVARRR